MQLKTTEHKYIEGKVHICIYEDVTIPHDDKQLVLIASQLCMDTTVTVILQPSNTLPMVAI